MSGATAPDVLVVGLGPAGAAAAAAAARAGARVLALERNARPGLPVQCAEFVPMLIGSDAPRVGQARVQDIAAMRTFVADEAADLTPDFRGYMIDRARFDQALIVEAQEAGALCRFAAPVRGVAADGAVTLASGEIVMPRVIVGADGPRSAVGRALGCPNRELVETRQITLDLLAPHDATDIFLRPEIAGGYGWLFPKGGRCNLGLGVVPGHKARLKPLLSVLHDRLADEGRVGRAVHRTTGGSIPVGGIVGLAGRLGPVAALLAGDAAGLTNPVTGAGINAAVVSGRLAGAAAAALVAGQADAGDDYAEEIKDTFGPSLALALRRRRALMAEYRAAGDPGAAALRGGWIAYPAYWDRVRKTGADAAASEGTTVEARETA